MIVRLTFQFSLDVIAFTEKLEKERKYNPANQLFKNGTSIGANVTEAQGCGSRADFIDKMKVFYKEAKESRCSLELCSQSEDYPYPAKLLDDVSSILRILGKIIHSSKT